MCPRSPHPRGVGVLRLVSEFADPKHIIEVNEQLKTMGVKVLHQFAVLGRYDFVNVVEASDDMTAAKAALELGSRGSIRVETLPAIPVKDLIAGLT